MSGSNDEAELTGHGGRLDLADGMFPDAPRPWIDLSTGINPHPYPVGPELGAAAWTRLPSVAALAELETAAARRYRAASGTVAVAGPGTQALIQRLPELTQGRDVRVLGPTYDEYARVFRAAGARVATVSRLGDLAEADTAVVVNPNNPDGRLVDPGELVALAGRVGTLVVDEAFADALPSNCSVASRRAGKRVIVLRSFGKFYGLAGLRLGFALCSPARADALRQMLGPWPVSGIAIALGTRALTDDGWAEQTRDRLWSDGTRLGDLLAGSGAAPVGATPLFRLVSHPAARALFLCLGRHGILVRRFAADGGWLRFGLPGGEDAWRRLEAALRAFGS